MNFKEWIILNICKYLDSYKRKNCKILLCDICNQSIDRYIQNNTYIIPISCCKNNECKRGNWGTNLCRHCVKVCRSCDLDGCAACIKLCQSCKTYKCFLHCRPDNQNQCTNCYLMSLDNEFKCHWCQEMFINVDKNHCNFTELGEFICADCAEVLNVSSNTHDILKYFKQ